MDGSWTVPWAAPSTGTGTGARVAHTAYRYAFLCLQVPPSSHHPPLLILHFLSFPARTVPIPGIDLDPIPSFHPARRPSVGETRHERNRGSPRAESSFHPLEILFDARPWQQPLRGRAKSTAKAVVVVALVKRPNGYHLSALNFPSCPREIARSRQLLREDPPVVSRDGARSFLTGEAVAEARRTRAVPVKRSIHG